MDKRLLSEGSVIILVASLFENQQATKVLQVMMLKVVIISLIHSIQSIL